MVKHFNCNSLRGDHPIEEILPPRCLHYGNVQYGSSYVAAHYCGFNKRRLPIRGEWAHGWHPSWHNVHPELVIGNSGATPKRRSLFVARDDQERYLKANGYKNASAIGMPVLYLERPKVERIPDSLIVFPMHSEDQTKLTYDIDGFLSEIKEVQERFEHVAACLHPCCIAKGYWVSELHDMGVPVISGAYLKDSSSLARMATIFSLFENMFSNGFGSHLVYGAYYGMRVSLSENLHEPKENDYKNAAIFRRCPELLSIMRKLHVKERLKEKLSFMFSKPGDAPFLVEWSERELGKNCSISPEEMKECFGWSPVMVGGGRCLYGTLGRSKYLEKELDRILKRV